MSDDLRRRRLRPPAALSPLLSLGLPLILSGAAFAASFPPLDWGWAAWGALVPLLAAAYGRRTRAVFWMGYAWGLVAFGAVLAWMLALGPVVWVLATLLLAVFPALALVASVGGRERLDRRGLLVFPVVWTAVEFLRSQGSLGFPWALLGESQHRALAVSQVASLAGVYGVSFLVASANASLALVLRRRAGAVLLTGTGLLLLVAVLWGTLEVRRPVPSRFLAAVVQPEYPFRTRWDPVQAARDFATLRRLTEAAAARGASLVVWPETASPTDIAGDPATLGRLRSWVRRDHVALIATSLEGGLRNAAFSLAPSGALLGRYDKHHLVPFAEAGEIPGRGPAVLPTPLGRVGVAICYESTFPALARQAVREGGVLLAVVTNDAWFGGVTAAAQHAAIAPFRAIEEGRYLLRAANGGLSQIVDPHGRVLALLPAGVRGVAVAPVAGLTSLTPYARLGDVFGWGTVVVALLSLLPGLVRVAASPPPPAFRRLLVASAVPLAALVVIDRLAPSPWAGAVPLPILGVAAASGLLSRLPRRRVGLAVSGFVPASLLGLAAVGGFAAVAQDAFSRHGGALPYSPPPGGWWAGGAVQVLIVGGALEWWLRGLVFELAAEWRGPLVALLWAAVLGMLAASPRGPEAMVWELAGGLVFGLIRLRWPQVPALALAHGAGNLLLGFLTSPW